MNDQVAVDQMTFEQAMSELEKTVDRLESGDTPLDESIKLYEYGSRLRKRCEATLKAAQEKIETITLNAEGEPIGKVGSEY